MISINTCYSRKPKPRPTAITFSVISKTRIEIRTQQCKFFEKLITEPLKISIKVNIK